MSAHTGEGERRRMKVIVAGSRQFNDFNLLSHTLNTLRADEGIVIGEIVSGGATGADALGEHYARLYKYPLRVMPAKWRNGGVYDPDAGKKRNEEMAQYANALVAFNLGTPGTTDMIARMRANGKPTVVVRKCDGCGDLRPERSLEPLFGKRGSYCNWCRRIRS